MGLISDAAVSRGDVVRQQAEIERDMEAARSARRSEWTSVGEQGLRFHSGGGWTIRDGGSGAVLDGGSITIDGGGRVIVSGGGGIGIADGGALNALYASGATAAHFGGITSGGVHSGHGLMILSDSAVGPRQIFLASQDLNGDRRVLIGFPPSGGAGPVDRYHSYATSYQHIAYGRMRLQTADSADIEILSDELLWLYGDSEVRVSCPNGNIQVLASGGTAGLGGAAGTFLSRQDGGSVSANVHMTTDGQILRVGSTERIKRDIADFEADPETVLRLRPRSWLPGPVKRHCPPWMHEQHADTECYAGEVIDPPEDARRQVGFIAEELDELGLADFVEYDEEARPSSIRYDRLAVALIPLLQQQQTQIDALTARLDALEGS